MLLLTIRADKPEAELGLLEDFNQLTYLTWLAHRELAESIHLKLKALLVSQHKELAEIQGILLFKGPGSFTGLRIGASVANALADALGARIIGSVGDQWIEHGIKQLLAGDDEKLVIPEYGSEPHITLPRK